MIRLKHLLQEALTDTYTLYVDMGGVLFKKMSADAGGSGDATEYIGETLWEKIKNLSPTILSAIGNDSDGKKKDVKRDQVNDYLTPTPPIIFVKLGTDKKSYANEKSILIDDEQTNIDAWERKSGIGIKHDSTNVQDTIDELKKYFNLD
jgi:hypothetical protein